MKFWRFPSCNWNRIKRPWTEARAQRMMTVFKPDILSDIRNLNYNVFQTSFILWGMLLIDCCSMSLAIFFLYLVGHIVCQILSGVHHSLFDVSRDLVAYIIDYAMLSICKLYVSSRFARWFYRSYYCQALSSFKRLWTCHKLRLIVNRAKTFQKHFLQKWIDMLPSTSFNQDRHPDLSRLEKILSVWYGFYFLTECKIGSCHVKWTHNRWWLFRTGHLMHRHTIKNV